MTYALKYRIQIFGITQFNRVIIFFGIHWIRTENVTVLFGIKIFVRLVIYLMNNLILFW